VPPAIAAVAAADDLDSSLEALLDAAGLALHPAMAAIFISDPDRAGLQLVASHGLDDAGREQLSREMEALSRQQEALAAQMETQSRVIESAGARVEQNARPMEALGRQMEEAGKPMEALGKQMEALGDRMDAVSKQAERETLQLIDEAMAKGLAKPAPVRQ